MIDRRWLAPALAGLVAVAVVAWALLSGGERYDLRWKFRAGETLEYRTLLQSGSEGNETCEVFETRYAVVSVSPEGTAQLTSLVERALARKGGPDGPLLWDSTSGLPVPRDIPLAFLAAITGHPIRMTVDARGKILAMDGLDAVKSRFRETMGGDLLGLSDLLFSGSGGSFHGPVLPSSPIRRGERWSVEYDSGNRTWGTSSVIEEYALKDVEEGVAVLARVGTTFRQTPGDMQKALGDPPPDPNAAYGGEGLLLFSLGQGVLLSERDRRWTQGTLTSGKLFRFEGRSQSVLMGRSR